MGKLKHRKGGIKVKRILLIDQINLLFSRILNTMCQSKNSAAEINNIKHNQTGKKIL